MTKRTARAIYRVQAVRSGKWWALSSPDVDGFFSQVRRLDQYEEMSRDAIALLLDVGESSFDVALDELVLGDPALDRAAAESRASRATAEHAAEVATAATTKAARALVKGGLSVREAGQVLGLSFQRVSQLTAAGSQR
ncbi:MAG: hypothetical protein H0U92_00635 [Actinobacteria bacterium]|nr:hypothetical protein [Actinomycetota bacterium]